MFKITFILILSYIIGSIPFAFIYCKLRGVDIRKEGSGNVGATNASRIFGKQAFFLIFFLDAFKGFFAVYFLIPVLIASSATHIEIIKISTLLAVIAGHVWPIFLNFKGGKGVATSAGGLIAIMPLACILSTIIFAIIFALKRIISLSSILAALTLPVFCYFTTHSSILIVFSFFLSLMIVFTHRENIKRLLNGTEKKI